MPRLDAPGTLHHLTIRAIDKRNFVDDRKDREALVSRMGDVATATPTAIYAWPLMTNHGTSCFEAGTRDRSLAVAVSKDNRIGVARRPGI